MEFQIRQATVEDISDIANIHVSSWQSAFDGLMPKGYIDSYTVSKRKIEWRQTIETNSETIYVAISQNQIVGFLSYFQAPHSTEIIELSKLYLCPSVYGKGLGNQLMHHFEKDIKQTSTSTISLYVLDCNESAIKFYTKQGFIFGNERMTDDYQDQTIVDVQMTKNLT